MNGLNGQEWLQNDSWIEANLMVVCEWSTSQGQGLCVVTVILEGKLEEMTAHAAGEKVKISYSLDITFSIEKNRISR